MPPSPDAFGSGNFGTPCARMQAAKSSDFCICFACSCAIGTPPLGNSPRQAPWAFLNCGEFGSIPFSEPMERRMPLPTTSGSGNFGRPCERMQAEKDTSASRLDLPVHAFSVVVVVDVESKCATFAPDEPPPQPAPSSAEVAAVTVIAAIEPLLPLQRLTENKSAWLGFICLHR